MDRMKGLDVPWPSDVDGAAMIRGIKRADKGWYPLLIMTANSYGTQATCQTPCQVFFKHHHVGSLQKLYFTPF